MAFFQDLLKAVPQAAMMTMSQNSGVPMPTNMDVQSLAQFVPQVLAANRQRKFYGDMMGANPEFATQYFTNLDNMRRTSLAEQELSIRQQEADMKAQQDARRAQALENMSNMPIEGVPALKALLALDTDRGIQMLAQQQIDAASPQNQLAQIELARQANTQRVLSGAQPAPFNPDALAEFNVPPITEEQLNAPYPKNTPTPFPQPPTQRQPEALASVSPDITPTRQTTPQQVTPAVTSLPDVQQIASQAETYRKKANDIISAGGDMQTAQSFLKLSSDLESTVFEREKEESSRQKTLIETEEGKKLRAQTLQDAIFEIENNVLPAIESAKKGVSKKFTGGAIGQVSKYVGGSPAFDLEADIDTVKSNIGIDTMIDMKQKSPNGASGMGALNEKEFEALKANLANLKIGLSDQKLLKNLETVRRQYARQLENAKKGYFEITGVSLDKKQGDKKPKIEVLGFE